MLRRSDCDEAPWACVRADHKKAARLNILRWMLHAMAPSKVRKDVGEPDPSVIFRFDPAALTDGRLHR